ncbi:MAG: amino acid deaminase [Micropruina sp.]|uniref:amino acid deaminase n=1 Tax=Micropruina sp. TaxID=2737536 RepID=UPI0039E57067
MRNVVPTSVRRWKKGVAVMGEGQSPRAGIDRKAVAELGTEVLDWRHKAVPAALHGRTAAEFGSGSVRLSDLQTPLLTLDDAALRGNVAKLAAWCERHGVRLAPHGKTTMAPALWAAQLEAGAWGITLANAAQLRVARRFGVEVLMLANSLTDPQAIGWVAGQVAGGARIVSWVDSVAGVRRLQDVLDAADAGPLEVLVEIGGHGGRTGARGVDAALEVAQAVRAASRLRLGGVSGYEGALSHSWDEAGLAPVRAYLNDFRRLHERLAADGGYDTDEVILTAGGSAYFDDVVEILGPCAAPGVEVILRSGAYVIHDDGFYRGISPFSRQNPDAEDAFVSAMHGWARVVSRTEPGLAILEGGKRDLPVDEGLPVPQGIARELGAPLQPLAGARITAVNDQHAFLAYPAEVDVRPGDVVRLGLSHPCTALDKWTLMPVLDGTADPANPSVVGTVRTFF